MPFKGGQVRIGGRAIQKTQSVRILRPLTREPARHFTLFSAEMTTPPGYPTGTPKKMACKDIQTTIRELVSSVFFNSERIILGLAAPADAPWKEFQTRGAASRAAKEALSILRFFRSKFQKLLYLYIGERVS